MSSKVVKFWLTGVTAQQKRLFADVRKQLGAAQRAMVCEWLRLAMADEPYGENAGKQRGREVFAQTPYSNDLVNTYAHGDAFVRFKAQWKAIRGGERSSVSFAGDAPSITFSGPNMATVEKRGDAWYLVSPRMYGGRTKAERARNDELVWQLDPVDNRRSDWCLGVMDTATRFSCVRLVPSEKHEGKWMAQITCEAEDAPAAGDVFGVTLYAGIDLGVNCPAVLSIPDKGFVRFLGREREEYPRLYGKIHDYEEAKRTLNRAGHKREARDLRPKLTALRQYVNECVSKQIVDLCLAHRVTDVRMENLKGMPKAPTGRLRYWPRYHLQQRLEQKLTAAGIRVEYVRAAGTSQTCSVCGHRDAKNRKGTSFVCIGCGWRQHADLNAANNIARKLETFGLAAKATAPDDLAGCGQASCGENPPRAAKAPRRLVGTSE